MLNYLLSGQLSIIGFMALLIALFTAISFHEFSHGWMANRLGDPTAKSIGRLTLNPLAHLDPIGSVCLLLFGFGWGKPVPINPFNFKNARRDSALVALAGPLSNFVLALLLALVLRIFHLNTGFFSSVATLFLYFNLILCLFNLLPFGPLDGFKIIGGFLPTNLAFQWEQNESLSLVVLFVLMVLPIQGTPILNIVLNPVLHFLLNLLLG